MNASITKRIPKFLRCPHRGAQMNLTGRGRAPGSVLFLCRRCVPLLQMKELWLGQVVRTNNQGFGHVQLHGPSAFGELSFELCDCVDSASGRPVAAAVGDAMLVLLGDDIRHASAIWKLPVAPKKMPANGRQPDVFRRRGVVTVLKSPLWGFLVDQGGGISYFVHQKDVLGGRLLAVGQQVTFLPARTPKGLKACEVQVQTR